MGQADNEYQKFVAESAQDPEVEKQLDSVIEEMINQGEEKYSDQQIVERLSNITGLGNQSNKKDEEI